MAASNLQKRVARKILERARVWGFPEGTHLAEKELAAVFGISRTPVRQALAQLAELGVLTRVPNQGYFMARPGHGLDDGLVENLTPDDESLYRRVVRDLLDGRIAEEVRERDLQRRYACSRSTVQRLMDYMQGEGLVEKCHGQGWRFQKALTSPDRYNASFRFRLLIEPGGVLEPAFAPDPDALDRLWTKHRQLVDGDVARVGYGHIYEVDAAFHETVAAWSNNHFIWDAVRQQNSLRRLTEYEFHSDVELFRESCRQHLRILDAIKHNDPNRASYEMADHIRWSWSISPGFGHGTSGHPTAEPAE